MRWIDYSEYSIDYHMGNHGAVSLAGLDRMVGNVCTALFGGRLRQ